MLGGVTEEQDGSRRGGREGAAVSEARRAEGWSGSTAGAAPPRPIWRRSGRRRPVDIVDETYIQAAPEVLHAIVLDRRNQRMWWPHLHLEVLRCRPALGCEWVVSGQLHGEMEVWLEGFREGTIVHHYVRAVSDVVAPHDVALRHTLRWKSAVTQLKDLLEAGRRSAPRWGR